MKKGLAALAAALVAALGAGATSASAANTTVVVTPNNFATVFPGGDVRPTSSYDFVLGPATPPLGYGSLQLQTVDATGKQQHLEYQQTGTALSTIDTMGYSTYRTTGSDQQVAAINMEIDYNGAAPGGFDTLVFEPVYNTDQGPVVSGQWQTWDAYNGGNGVWWSTHDIPGVCAFTCYVPWSTIVANNPDATLTDYGVNQGSGNPGLTTSVDALKIGASGSTTTYDFEPLIGPPTSKDQCKKDGWQRFNNPSFKNQGDCVSYVATGGRNG